MSATRLETAIPEMLAVKLTTMNAWAGNSRLDLQANVVVQLPITLMK